jgi:hypothetical protein
MFLRDKSVPDSQLALMRTDLKSNWSEKDRLTYVKWMRGIAVFYGCIAFLVFALLVLTKPLSVAPNDRQTSSVGLEGAQTNHTVDVSWKTRFKGENQRNR